MDRGHTPSVWFTTKDGVLVDCCKEGKRLGILEAKAEEVLLSVVIRRDEEAAVIDDTQSWALDVMLTLTVDGELTTAPLIHHYQ